MSHETVYNAAAAAVSVHKTVVKENICTLFIVFVLLYNLAKYYQNRFTIKKIIAQKRRGEIFWNSVYRDFVVWASSILFNCLALWLALKQLC